jgi:hypothetical protein
VIEDGAVLRVNPAKRKSMAGVDRG